jgi:ABC-type branched-subunit amino acid transport system ATPase component
VLSVVVGGGEIISSIIAALAFAVLPSYITSARLNDYLPVLFGMSAVLVSLRLDGVSAGLARTCRRSAAAAVFREPDARTCRSPVEGRCIWLRRAGGGRMTSLAPGLRIEDVVVRFGGLVAVDGVSLVADIGEAVGLIGPKGAGKTTTFNVCSGLIRPTFGAITLFGRDATSMSPAVRARLGLGRTFQRMELYDRLSVRENVAMGREGRLAGARLLGSVLSTRAERKVVAEATDQALARCGISHLADRRAGLLPSGQRRLVELARALAGDHQMLLLDKPSSGLDQGETGEFAAILRRVVDEDSRGLLLVEHDMSPVRRVCDRAYVLDFGKLIAQGDTAEVLSSAIVKAAYLGNEDAA